MKQKMNFAQITRTVLWLGLIVCISLTAARAQVPNGTVIPSVCFEDVAVFVDGAFVGARRVIISNFPLPSLVSNWALSFGQTLAPGSHTIEVRALNGFGGTANSSVSSSSDPLLRGQLTVAVIRK